QLFLRQPLVWLDRIGLLSADPLFARAVGAGVEDIGLSPVALVLVPLGLWAWCRGTRGRLPVGLGLGLAAAIWLTMEATLGRGLIWPLLKPLPFFRSLHENSRFAAA